MAVNQKASLRDIDFNILHQQFKDGLQYAVIDYLKAYKLTDIMFLRGSSNEYHNIYRYYESSRTFTEVQVNDSSFNILQLACLGGHYDLVKYIMLEHKIFSNSRQTRAIDPRIILLNNDMEDDESLTLRFAVQSGNVEIFKLLWDCYPKLYTESHLMSVARYCIILKRFDLLVHLLASPTSGPIYLGSPVHWRSEFVDLFDEVTL